ncbi:MAG TPA: hypothetical protein VF543_22220 [Pyrinomonadaceae bacterium]|jgi:hypothetical protein
MNAQSIQQAADFLLINREWISATRASVYLATRARVRTPLGAAEFLGRALDHDRETYNRRVRVALEVISMYREFFPDEYARSGAPYFSTEREHEFYRLVNLKLFPLLLSEEADLETHIRNEPNFFLPFIPMKCAQKHNWALGPLEFEDVEIEYRLALAFSACAFSGTSMWELMKQAYDLNGMPEPAPPLGVVGWQLFDYSCSIEDSPIRFLPAAFNMVSYKTGNHWLDLPPLGYIGFEWSREQLGRLTIAWHQAQGILMRMKELGSWLEEAPAERIIYAVKLWNKAAQVEKEYGYEGTNSTRDMLYARMAAPTGLYRHGEPLVHMTIPGEMFRDLLADRQMLPPAAEGENE